MIEVLPEPQATPVESDDNEEAAVEAAEDEDDLQTERPRSIFGTRKRGATSDRDTASSAA